MIEVFHEYRKLLAEVDAWYARCHSISGGESGCRGCSECCRGLFDITLLDALLLRHGFGRLPKGVREEVLAKTGPVLTRLRQRFAGFDHPYLLSGVAAEDLPLRGEENTPCPLLDAAGRCLLYAWRPLTCRLYGLPHVDISGEVFLEDRCPNAPGDLDPLLAPDLRWDFRRAFTEEGRLLRKLAACLGLPADADLDTFIPTALLLDVEQLETLRKKIGIFG